MGQEGTGKQVAAEPRPLPAAIPPRPDSRPVRGKHSPSGAPSSFPDPRGRPTAPQAAGLKAPSARSRRGRPAPGGFSPAKHGLCNRIVKDHGSSRKSEGPHSAKGGFILQRGTHSDPGFQGEGIRGFRTVECGKNKTLPSTQAHHHLLPAGWGEEEGRGSSGPLCLRLHRSARLCQVWGGLSLYRRKKDLKALHYCGFSIKDHQHATGCGSYRKQGEENKRNRSKLRSA